MITLLILSSCRTFYRYLCLRNTHTQYNRISINTYYFVFCTFINFSIESCNNKPSYFCQPEKKSSVSKWNINDAICFQFVWFWNWIAQWIGRNTIYIAHFLHMLSISIPLIISRFKFWKEHAMSCMCCANIKSSIEWCIMGKILCLKI